MTAGGGSKGGFTMQSLQAKHQVQVAQSNKHHPLNQETERHLHTLIDQEKLDQKGYENLYVLQFLEWGLEEYSN